MHTCSRMEPILKTFLSMEREGRCRIGISPSAFDPSLSSTINHPSWIGFILTWIQAPFQQQRHIHSVLHACRNTCCPTWIQAPPLLRTHAKAHTASHMHVRIKDLFRHVPNTPSLTQRTHTASIMHAGIYVLYRHECNPLSHI